MMRTARLIRKPSLLAGCALAACLAALPAGAKAQGLQGTPTTVAGSDPIFNTAPNYTQVVVRSQETVINWTPFDTGGTGTIDFLPAGATAEFTEVSGTIDYTVLNRILPVDALGNAVSRPVAFNGTVISLTGNFPGGNVWIYSPTGIIAGPTAVFNVGSLILTTDDIVFGVANTGGTDLFGPGGLVQFQGPAGSTGFVDIQNGARITATGSPFGPGYVALVAPRVIQAGTVQADGQIAYIAAEQLDMTINGGLFDFTLTVGTTDPNGVVHTGTTTGPASTSAADQQRLSMVALPKNDALTMLLAGSIGYTAAVSAANEGSSIVLAAGFDTDDPTAVPANRLGSIAIGNATFSNALTGYATDDIAIAPTGSTVFEASSSLYALDAIDITAAAGAQVTAGSDLALYAGEPGTGGAIALSALGTGQITIGNTLIANASSNAALYAGPSPAIDAAGGQVTILADGGTIGALNALVSVDAAGGFDSMTGGTAAGGAIDLSVLNGGTVSAGMLDLSARGFGGESIDQGGSGFGGAVNLADLGGTLDFGTASISAFGSGGPAEVIAGSGTGGNVVIAIGSQAQAWDNLFVNASASSGVRLLPAALTSSATALNDAVALSITGPGALSLTGDLVLTANSYTDVNGAPGFAGHAGGIDLTVDSGGDLTVAGMIFAHASALTAADGSIPDPDSSPVQQGGTVSLLADGGSITADGLSALASAVGTGASAAAGSASGGTASVTVRGGGTLQLALAGGTSLVEIRADGYGAPGPVPADAFGGAARLQAEDGTVTVAGLAVVSANAVSAELSGPPVGDGFAAFGGTASVDLLAGALGTGVIDVTDLRVQAIGDARAVPLGGLVLPGGEPIEGNGGTGTGGSTGLLVEAGSLTVGAATIDATGRGGASAAIDSPGAWQSGDGFGGSSQLIQSGGTADIGTLALGSAGFGGGGSPAAAASELAALAGSGTGGSSTLTLTGGSLDVADTLIEATGVGAHGMDHDGSGDASDGGAGTAGTAALVAPGGWNGSFSTTTLTVSAHGEGGNGGVATAGTNGSGGMGIGSNATVDLADGAFLLGDVAIGALGIGGNGAIGGEGTGGLARFAVVDTAAGPVGPRSLGDLFIGASGFGGNGAGGTSGPSSAGAVELVADTLDAASGIVINGSVVLNSKFGFAGPSSGVTIDVAGAPLEIGGNLTVEAAGDIGIAAAQALSAGADAFFSAERSFTSTGLVATDGFLTVQGATGVTAERLSSGGTTFLGAAGGPLTVSVDLASTGPVTAIGQSVDITSLGALTFADLDATAGDLSVTTAGNLALATAHASGAVALTSTGGAIAATGAVNAGGAVSADGVGGVSFAQLVSGGTTLLRATGGAVDVDSLTSSGAVTAFGQSVDIVSPGALTFANLVSTAGPLSVVTSGDLSLPGASAAGALTLRSTGGAIAATGPINASGAASLEGLLGVAATFLNSGATTNLLSGPAGTIDIDTLVSSGAVSVNGGNVDIAGSGPLSFVEAEATGIMTIRASGNLAFTDVNAASDLILNSTGGSLTATGGVAGGPTQLGAATDILIEGGLTSNSALVANAGGSFIVQGAASASDTDIVADGGIRLTSLNSGGSPQLTADNGAIAVSELTTFGLVTARGLEVDIASTGALFVDGAATAGGFRAQAGGELVAGAIDASGLVELQSTDDYLRTVAEVRGGTVQLTAADDVRAEADVVSAGDLTVDAGSSFVLTGSARGVTVAVLSADIALDAGSQLGSRGLTTDITLANRDPATTTFIGGEPETTGYSLEQAEAARLFADGSITIASDGDMAIGDLALNFGGTGNIGTGGRLEISSPGEVHIHGDVALGTSSADDTFRIDPRLIALHTDTGSISMFSGEGVTANGRLELVGDMVVAATDTVIGQLETLTDLNAINALLDQPGGTGDPISVGTIDVEVIDGLYIQNSGASAEFADRRGFAAAELSIATESADTQIAINGQILRPVASGGPVTGLDVVPLVTINGAPAAAGGQFDARSTINGCVIGANCVVVPEPEFPEFTPPTSEDVDPIPPGQGPGLLFAAPLIELAGTEPLVTPPLVDEPITGVGNDDLWEPRCDPDDDDDDEGACREDGSAP